MSVNVFRNGYTRIPTADPDQPTKPPTPGGEGKRQRRHPPHSLRPGLFYMFGERGRYVVDHSESEEIEMREVKPPRRPKHRKLRSPKSPKTPKGVPPKIKIIEEPILPDDTVQRVALRYGVQDSEIRRVNNLYKDQDFFALRTVKIPVREHGVLTEPQELEKRRKSTVKENPSASGNQSSSTSDELRLGGPGTYYRSDDEGAKEGSSCDADDEKGDSDGPEYRDISIQSALKWKYSRHTLLQKFDEDLQRVRQDTEQRASNLREVALTLDSPAFQPIVSTRNSYEKSLFHFAIDWRILIAGFFLLVILLLLAYASSTCYLHWSDCKKLFKHNPPEPGD